MLRTIRSRILGGSFVLLTLTTSILITVNNTYFRKRAAITDIAYSIQEFNANLYRLINLGLEIDTEIENDQFDETLFEQQRFLFRTIQIELDNLQHAANNTNIDINDNIAALVVELKKYEGQREKIERLYWIKEENAISNRGANAHIAHGLKGYSTYIEAYSNAISAKILFAKKKIYKELRFYYLCITVGIIFLALTGGAILSISVSKPLKSFSSYISGFVSSNFKTNNPLILKGTYLELKNISDNFNLLVHELFEHEKQRDEAIKTLEIERTQYKQLTELLPLSIFETDITSQLVYYNNSFRKKFRIWDKQKVYYLKDFIQSADKYQMIEQNVSLEGFEVKAVKSDSTEFPALIFFNTINNSKNTGGKRGIVVDMSERMKYINALKREKQRAEVSDRLKSAFLANVSHEIRTPMNGILGFSEILSNVNIPAEERKMCIEQIKNSGDILLKLIDDIIDFAKLESGVVSIHNEKTNIGKLLEEIYNYYRVLILNSKPDINFIFNNRLPEETYILIDRSRLKQILINLLNNAVKFTAKGYIELNTEREGEELVVSVSDSGTGISSDKLGVIFDRFRQADESTNRNYGGTGLGLSISKQLIELMHGTISVASENGVGSEFVVRLPLVIDSNHGVVVEPDKSGPVNFETKKVLIAEDEDISYKLFCALLRTTGITILRAVNGNEAVNICKASPDIDIILMDLNMPDLNGFEATKKIRSFNKAIPIIAQTAYALDSEKEKAVETGCNDVITKPLDRDLLFSKLEYFFLQNSEIECLEVLE